MLFISCDRVLTSHSIEAFPALPQFLLPFQGSSGLTIKLCVTAVAAYESYRLLGMDDSPRLQIVLELVWQYLVNVVFSASRFLELCTLGMYHSSSCFPTVYLLYFIYVALYIPGSQAFPLRGFYLRLHEIMRGALRICYLEAQIAVRATVCAGWPG